ncbi:MAG: tetratricopeptide repeat protein [Saprospiraceae bacterium]|nr:tetratricopeptide repeat protein [Saprospiraceae bacterium]
MENKIKRDTAFINLVSDFESRFEQGEVGYLEEKIFFQLIEYYEDEYLYEKSLEVVDIALQQYKYRSDFYIVKARLQLNLNKIDAGLETLRIAENVAPFEREIGILKARAYAFKKQFDLAQEILQDLSLGATKSDFVDILIAESFVYEHMKDFDAMYNALATAVAHDCRNEEAMERIWISVELSRRYEDSVELHKSIINNDPYNYQAWYNLGHGYICIGEYEKAIEALEYSFIVNPEFESAYLDCADICREIRNFERALEIYVEANTKFGPNHELMVNIAQCNIELNRIGVAKQWLLKSIRRDSYNDEAYYLLGECYAKDGIWYNAINAYHKAIDIETRREEYYLGLAKAYVAVEDYNKATINFQKATETGPEETLYWREYASFLVKLGLYDEALQVLDEADEHTYGTDLVYCRAAALYLSKDKEECMFLLEDALPEDYASHTIIFDLAPEIRLDKEIWAMVKYYKEE